MALASVTSSWPSAEATHTLPWLNQEGNLLLVYCLSCLHNFYCEAADLRLDEVALFPGSMSQRLAKTGFLRGLLEDEASASNQTHSKKGRLRLHKRDAAHKINTHAHSGNATSNVTAAALPSLEASNSSVAEPHSHNR